MRHIKITFRNMLPVKIRVQMLEILNYSKDLDILADEARWQQSMNVQLLSLFQGKSQVLWRKGKHDNSTGEKDKTLIYTPNKSNKYMELKIRRSGIPPSVAM